MIKKRNWTVLLTTIAVFLLFAGVYASPVTMDDLFETFTDADDENDDTTQQAGIDNPLDGGDDLAYTYVTFDSETMNLKAYAFADEADVSLHNNDLKNFNDIPGDHALVGEDFKAMFDYMDSDDCTDMTEYNKQQAMYNIIRMAGTAHAVENGTVDDLNFAKLVLNQAKQQAKNYGDDRLDELLEKYFQRIQGIVNTAEGAGNDDKTENEIPDRATRQVEESRGETTETDQTSNETDETTETSITSLSHTQLLAQNPTYANNYKYVQDHFGPAVSKTCADIAGERALTPDEQRAYQLATYEDFTHEPQAYTTQLKKAKLIIYYNDVAYNNKPKAQIDQKFAQLMRETKLFIATDNPASVPIPQNPNAEQSIDDVGASEDETGGY